MKCVCIIGGECGGGNLGNLVDWSQLLKMNKQISSQNSGTERQMTPLDLSKQVSIGVVGDCCVLLTLLMSTLLMNCVFSSSSSSACFVFEAGAVTLKLSGKRVRFMFKRARAPKP